jgi:glutamate---cysteine ligase / carboxylate-amine ligase
MTQAPGKAANSPDMEFRPSTGNSVGVELELQILNSRDYNLARDAADLIDLLEKTTRSGAVKPEITESMVELNTSVHHRHDTMVKELQELRDAVSNAADRLNVRIAGGGSHPFHDWGDRRIYPTERFKQLLELYGYLAKQFTVFGQHVHLGCRSGDEAIYLAHMLGRYVPHFIALSASSPFQQGQDTSYQSSRLNTVSAFPLAGQIPFVLSWAEFLAYFEKMRSHGIAESMKDFYWDIRPKPEYGTVEIRVFDTPLTVERAAALAAYAQALGRYLVTERPRAPSREVYLVYGYNRFQACRYGLDGTLIDVYEDKRVSLRVDVVETIARIEGYAADLGSTAVMQRLAEATGSGCSDAGWLRDRYKERGSLHDVARLQSDLWMGKIPVPA